MMTTAEYLQTPETVVPQELIFGAMRVAESPTGSHQRAVLNLALEIAPFVRQHRLGELVISPMDVILDFDAALVVQPDLLFISEQRSHIFSDKVYGAPDLVIEVLSPHPRIGTLAERLGWFARYGVRECWLARLPEKELSVLALTKDGIESETTYRGGNVIKSAVLPNLELRPLDIYGW
jgi:Uma2 family endonuclease